MSSQMQNSFTNWVFSFLDQSSLMKGIPWIFTDPFLVAIEVSQKVNDMLYWNVKNFYDSFSYVDQSMNKIDDPFKETKKKCLPENIDHFPMNERSNVIMENSYFVCTPLTLEKRDGPSFSDKTMHNLILDKNNILMQLLFAWNLNSSFPPWQELMQVIEYKVNSKTIARKFQTYIGR